ncbi:hypothetical protein F4809DRAFT_378218 [Biscogniauxia mediterranea]|nr:hypothetical protein F4809DRAFT_378218 [Biscogniauxia mediterranea]
MFKGKFAAKRASVCSLSLFSGPDTVKVVVGAERRNFFISRQLLASCQFFRDQIDSTRLKFADGQAQVVILLENQCPYMFNLFSFWLHEKKGFDSFIDEADADDCCEELHWDLVNLHLFAAQVGLPALQDLAMDGIQDLYLRCNWDINPKLISYIYNECDPQESCRIRKWMVAMSAWTLGGVGADAMADRIRRLFDECPGFWEEYDNHLKKMHLSKLQLQLKNPQLRLPSNSLRGEERQFGFRRCSFHTHRSTIGQGKCPSSIAFQMASPSSDGYLDSDSERGSLKSGSRIYSVISNIIHESDLESP